MTKETLVEQFRITYNEKQSISKAPIVDVIVPDDVLAGDVRTISYYGSIHVALFPDGSGLIFERSSYFADGKHGYQLFSGDTFIYNIDNDELEELRALALNDAEEYKDKFENIFLECINPNLEDPYYHSHDEMNNSQDIIFKTGCEQDLKDITRLIVYSEPGYKIKPLDGSVVFRSGAEQGDDNSYYSAEDTELDVSVRQELLFNAAGEIFSFSGWETEYNDGSSDQHSGYSTASICIYVDFDIPPSAHQVLNSEAKLKDILKKYGRSYEDILGLKA